MPPQSALRRSILPSAASLAIHGALLAAAVGVTVHHLAPPERGPVVLELDAPNPGPPRPPQPPPPAAAPASKAPSPDTPAPAAVRAAAEDAILRPAATLAAPPEWTAPPAPPAPILTRAPDQPAAAFAGLQARAATRIVYVVDASGSMVHTLSFVLDELARSISRLQPTQAFNIVLLGDRPDHPPLRLLPIEPDRDGLVRATPAARQAAREWLNAVVAGGRSNPTEGLRTALELDPDLVFLLARGIQRTGTDWGEGVDATLEELDRLNPRDPDSPFRPATIKTIQFIDEDPTGLLTRIARDHGDGEGSTRVVHPEQFETDPAAAPETIPRALADAVDRAAAALAPAERDLAALAALAGVATPRELETVRDAAASALTALADAPPATTRTPDPRPQLLRARAALLAAACETDPGRGLDLARRALADAGPLPIVDPAADAQRDMIVAAARARAGAPRPAHEELLALLRDADENPLDPTALAAARLLLLDAADAIQPRGPEARRARDAIARSLERDPRDRVVWPDPAWRAIAAASLARSLRDAREPTPAVVAPLLALLDDRALPLEQRQALVIPRLAAVAEELDDLPAPALDALAAHAAWNGQPDLAAERFLQAANRTTDPDARAASLRAAAAVLRARGETERARTLFLRLAAERPGTEQALHALTLAFDAPGATPDQLAHALELAPDHPLADAWRLDLAAARRGRAGLALLDTLSRPSEAGDTLALSILDELLAGPDAGDAALLARAAAAAQRLGPAVPEQRRLELAAGLLATDPARALDALAALRPGDPEADTLRLRALLALRRNADAFALARDLAKRLEPDPLESAPPPRAYWEAATIWLELGAERGGPAARAAARAHIARLRLAHPALGGEPWATRLSKLAN